MSTSNITKLIQELKVAAASPPQDEKLRKDLYDAAQSLSLAIESPYDTIYRVIYSVSNTEDRFFSIHCAAY
jgi:hypothetical protein